MLSRSSLSIRRLIRSETPFDAEDASDPDEVTQVKLQDQMRRALPSRTLRSKKKKGSQDQSVLVQCSQSTNRLSAPYPPACETSPRSSKGSFSLSRSSLERQLAPWSKRAASTSDLPPPSLSVAHPDDDMSGTATNSNFTFLPEIRRPSGGIAIVLPPLQDTTTVGCAATALSPIPDAAEPETPQEPKHDAEEMAEPETPRTDRDSLRDWSASLQKLIQETEEAFQPAQDLEKPVPPPLSPSESTIDMSSPPKETKPPVSPPAVQTTPEMGAAQLNVFSRKPVAVAAPVEKHATPPHSPTPSLTTPTRRSSMSKATPTRTGPTKTYKKHKPRPSKKMPRWLLSENVTGILTGQFFKKIEADEMLTPEQLETVRASAEFQRRKKQSSDIRNSVRFSMAKPIEPVPVASSSAGDQPRTSGDVKEGEQQQQQQQQQERDQEHTTILAAPATETQDDEDFNFKADEDDDDDDDLMWLMVPTGLRAPPPPPRNPARQAGRPLPLQVPHPPLPTIPEVTVTAPAEERKETKATTATTTDQRESPEERGMSQPQPKSPFAPTEDDEFIYYQSTPYSLSMPTLRHGPIRLPKPDDMVPGMQLAPDTTLDWTAFQMAILGGAGDFFSDPSEFTGHANEGEVRELTSWFEGFGFGGPGRLLTSEEEEEEGEDGEETGETRPRAQTMESMGINMESTESTPSSSGSTKSRSSLEYSSSCSTASDPDLDLPIPLAEEYPSGFWNGSGADAARFVQGQGGIKRWTMEGHPRKRSLPLSETGRSPKHNSLGSLPQSPMMDFVFMNLDDDDDDVVPMGYNLHHDLGDFLKWEAENAYAGSPWGLH
ncbi:hypothetical protein ACRALDRAFT_1082115 [Sodiomyces alcalophilus JCM 7366]|uniref:uncharacterized protein n=1 Tax=Sodiomyces alcalophilus JCM 7366 TaxID=591952 RepID=UPI0039B6D379